MAKDDGNNCRLFSLQILEERREKMWVIGQNVLMETALQLDK